VVYARDHHVRLEVQHAVDRQMHAVGRGAAHAVQRPSAAAVFIAAAVATVTVTVTVAAHLFHHLQPAVQRQ